MTSLHEQIRAARLAAGMTQVELGQACGLAQNRISVIEDGRYLPTIATLDRLAAALGATYDGDGRKPVSFRRSS